ncbi:carboxypeptidase-like regulatory domain-containing protein [Chitinophaga rhizophila]|uniref:TonB-dependent receptor n=1 Tax=Chitinophaga rhizophila TaxID=2866212 RepID=A0ABS7G5C0_9BACT|nr:carboxypeptidase-like regulatory domain-containing protein [Chitinophaga rhizophila]MBW8682857.1 TonB-dependent receptor [Chitinophaga rhizophila]
MAKAVINILLLSLLAIACHAQTTDFTISKGTRLDQALAALSARSGVHITFNPEEARQVKLAAQDYQQQPVRHIISSMLQGTDFSYRLQGSRLVIYKHTSATKTTPAVPTNHSVSGRVVNEEGIALPAATIRITELNQFSATDAQGYFHLQASAFGNFTLEISYVGYQQQTLKLSTIQADTILANTVMKEVSLRLKDIAVTASRTFEASSNSSLIINREMIEQTTALSLNDLLNHIPNKQITPPSLQNVQNINLRANFFSTQKNKGAFELNNAFGVAIVMDGNTLSNNMNMQTFNPGHRGIAGSFLSSPNTYGLRGTGTSAYTGDYTFGGTDLRQITPDNIERIEVVSGVASAKYGDLTDGAIIIERQAGISKGYFRTQLRDNATSTSFSKGFRLSEKAGVMNAGFSYVNSYADSRDKLKAYRRINGNVIWTNYFGKEHRLKITTIADYGRNLDGIKRDPDDPTSTIVRFDSWNFSISNKAAYRVNSRFVKNVSLNVRYSEGHQYSYREWQMNEPYVLYTDATTTGIHQGIYDRGIYTAESIIDGRPVNMTASLDISNEYRTGRILHFLTMGGNYSYGKNKGLGQAIDPGRPRSTTDISPNGTRGARSERYYDFSRVIAQQDLGIYAEDVFKANVRGRYLHVRAGARLDVQNGYVTGSPRININYEASNKLRLGVAYGLAYKSPGLAMRYPGPIFTDIPLLNAYNGNVAESESRIFVHRYDPSNVGLRSSSTQTLELSAQYKHAGFSLSSNVYSKWSRNGIGTLEVQEVLELPVYTAQYRPGLKPLVTQTGTRRYLANGNIFRNLLNTNSQGVELMVSTPKVKSIETSFNLSAGINRSAYHSSAPVWMTRESGVTAPAHAYMGRYPSSRYTSYFSNGRISSITHIPKISLMLQFTAECNFLNKTLKAAESGIPDAYFTNDLQFVSIKGFDQTNPAYGHLLRPESELNQENIPRAVMNYHLSIGKEIKKRFRFSFNVYNVFNYQPYYINSGGTYNFPNSAPTFGAEMSIKI